MSEITISASVQSAYEAAVVTLAAAGFERGHVDILAPYRERRVPEYVAGNLLEEATRHVRNGFFNFVSCRAVVRVAKKEQGGLSHLRWVAEWARIDFPRKTGAEPRHFFLTQEDPWEMPEPREVTYLIGAAKRALKSQSTVVFPGMNLAFKFANAVELTRQGFIIVNVPYADVLWPRSGGGYVAVVFSGDEEARDGEYEFIDVYSPNGQTYTFSPDEC